MVHHEPPDGSIGMATGYVDPGICRRPIAVFHRIDDDGHGVAILAYGIRVPHNQRNAARIDRYFNRRKRRVDIDEVAENSIRNTAYGIGNLDGRSILPTVIINMDGVGVGRIQTTQQRLAKMPNYGCGERVGNDGGKVYGIGWSASEGHVCSDRIDQGVGVDIYTLEGYAITAGRIP